MIVLELTMVDGDELLKTVAAQAVLFENRLNPCSIQITIHLYISIDFLTNVMCSTLTFLSICLSTITSAKFSCFNQFVNHINPLSLEIPRWISLVFTCLTLFFILNVLVIIKSLESSSTNFSNYSFLSGNISFHT